MLGAVVSVAFSTVAAFVSAAVFSSLVIVTLVSRATNVLRDISVAAVATAFALGGYFLVLIIPHSSASLRGYWRGYYLDGGPFHEITVTWHRLSHLAPNFAMPEIAIVALLVLGTIFIAGLGRKAVALAIPLLWIEMMILATLQRYPFLDQRTSQFLVITSLTVIAVGVAGLIISLASRSRILAVVLTLVVAVGFWRGAEPHIRSHGAIQNEDVRSQVRYVVQHRHDGDVIVVSLESVYAFGYYWPGAKNAYFVDHTGTNATGYTTRVTNLDDLVYADGRMTPNTTDAMRQAIALGEGAGWDRSHLARSHPPRPHGNARLEEHVRHLRTPPAAHPRGLRVTHAHRPARAARTLNRSRNDTPPRVDDEPGPGHFLYTVEADGEPAGSLWIGPASDERPGEYWVWDIVIAEARRDQVAGRPMVLVSRYSSKPATPCSRPWPLSL